MNKHIILYSIFFCFQATFAEAQQQLRGTIIDEATLEPLAFATIYLNTTSIGTTSDNEGSFNFQVPEGEHEVIVQFVGYKTLSFTVNSKEIAPQYKIKLQKETQELASVKINGERDKEWYENLKIFKSNFIGTSENALACKILNEKSLVIDYDPQKAALKVIAKEPLQILNSNLGYILHYSLVEFNYELRQGKLFFAGYPYFKENKLSGRKLKKVEKNRRRAYHGSLVHFIKSLLNNSLQKEGFRVMNLYRVPNPERPSDSIISAIRKEVLFGNLNKRKKDSLRTNVLEKRGLPKNLNMLDTTALSANELIVRKEDKIYMRASNLLQIVYQNEKEELNYLTHSRTKKPGLQTSILNIVSGEEELNLAGDITNPSNVFLEGYLAWEKIGDLLPLDYVPPPN
ncbi:carboxypeptidase-like regulatory domain-containing protein [Marivirga lumbricoides]|uniref:carboxypeptidase-like regulatory domain-containing protein n=1 Tax=Marivirga lumbricoides TaxID=1046115 RepID=UPI0016688044